MKFSSEAYAEATCMRPPGLGRARAFLEGAREHSLRCADLALEQHGIPPSAVVIALPAEALDELLIDVEQAERERNQLVIEHAYERARWRWERIAFVVSFLAVIVLAAMGARP